MTLFGFDWYYVLPALLSLLVYFYGRQIKHDTIAKVATLSAALTILAVFWSY